MDAIEKRARELLAAEYKDRGSLVDAMNIEMGGQTYAAELAAIIAALLQGRPVDLLDQDGASRIEAQELQVVPSAAFGADEAGSVRVDQVSGGLPRDIQLAEVAPEVVASGHLAGVRPEGDGQATADRPARDLETVERVAKAMQAAEQAQSGWTWGDCSPIEVEGWMDLARAAIAALAPPQGYVLVPVVPTKQMIDAAVPTSSQDQTGRRQRALWDAMLAARPEAP